VEEEGGSSNNAKSQHSPVETEENYEKLDAGQQLDRPRLKLGTSRKYIKSYHYTKTSHDRLRQNEGDDNVQVISEILNLLP
jgi:hypothetical protein